MSLGWMIRRLVLPLAACMILGTAWHEVVGHGGFGILRGGHVAEVELFGCRVYPAGQWQGWIGYYGRCRVEGIPTPRGSAWMLLGGSMSTWLVALLATGALWLRRWNGRARRCLAWLSLWWIDGLTYTLPVWGLKRSLLWGGTHAEPYAAAVDLGLSGRDFQIIVVGSSIAMAILLLLRLRQLTRLERESPP